MLHKHCFSPTVAHCQALIVIGWQDSKQQKWAEEQTSDRPQCHEEKNPPHPSALFIPAFPRHLHLSPTFCLLSS